MLKLLLINTLFQVDTLPPKEALFASIDSFYQLQTQKELLEFQTSKKGNWLKYLPSLGMTYTLDGKLRPVISFNSSILFRSKKDQQLMEQKRLAIQHKHLQAAQKKKLEVKQDLFQYQSLQEELQFRDSIWKIDSLIFEIDERQYHRLELAPSEYLARKKQLLQKWKEFWGFRNRLEGLEREVLGKVFLR